MLAVSGSLVTNVILAVLTVPMGVFAYYSIRDRKARIEESEHAAEQRRNDQKTIDLIGTAFFGPDKSKWPNPEDEPAVATMLKQVAHQVRPSNGKTLAMTAEETRSILEDHAKRINQKIDDRNKQIDEMHEGMVKWGVLVAEHVSDGHGGQKSW